jgi:hypothetical protein
MTRLAPNEAAKADVGDAHTGPKTKNQQLLQASKDRIKEKAKLCCCGLGDQSINLSLARSLGQRVSQLRVCVAESTLARMAARGVNKPNVLFTLSFSFSNCPVSTDPPDCTHNTAGLSRYTVCGLLCMRIRLCTGRREYPSISANTCTLV